MEFRKALLYTFTSKYLLLLIQFGSTLILSRLLTPADIGIFTIAYSIVAIGHIFRDFGVGNYIQQEKNLTQDRLRAAMSIALFFAWVVSVSLYFGADFAASFYEEDGVKEVFQVLAINFFLIPFGSVTTSYIRRQMRFKFVMRVEVICSLVSTATVVTLAFLGFSYMSMAWSSVAGIVVEIAILLCFRPKELPSFPGLKEVKHVLGFSSASVSEALLSNVALYLPDLIIGKFISMNSVGLLSRAQGTIRLFDRAVTDGINPVLLPYFSKENREGGDVNKHFLYVTKCITGLSWPVFAYMAIMAEPLIVTLYGDKWAGAVVLLQIICIKAGLWKILNFFHPVMMAKGKVKLLLLLQSIFVPIYLLVILFSIRDGIITMLWAVSLFSFIRLLITIKIMSVSLNIAIKEFYDLTIRSLIPTLVCSAGVLLFQNQFHMVLSNIEILLASSFICGVLFLLSIAIIKHPVYLELKNLVNRKK